METNQINSKTKMGSSLLSLVRETFPLLDTPVEESVVSHKENCGSLTTFISLFKFAFGTGLLALPFGMEAAGLIPSVSIFNINYYIYYYY